MHAVLRHATCRLIVPDWCKSQSIYQVTSVASLHLFSLLLRLLPLRRRVASRRQLDAIEAATNVIVVVEALTLQAVTLPLTDCRNMVCRVSRETLCLFRSHRAIDVINSKDKHLRSGLSTAHHRSSVASHTGNPQYCSSGSSEQAPHVSSV